MKVGSIVECIYNYHNGEYDYLKPIGVILPKLKNIYTIRDIYKADGYVFLLLEEICNDAGYGIECFREVEFPDDLQSQINEALKSPLKEFELV